MISYNRYGLIPTRCTFFCELLTVETCPHSFLNLVVHLSLENCCVSPSAKNLPSFPSDSVYLSLFSSFTDTSIALLSCPQEVNFPEVTQQKKQLQVLSDERLARLLCGDLKMLELLPAVQRCRNIIEHKRLQ